ncbi:MAG: hypothetical protein K1000chlam2_00589 [Chlamydiae bacterium]|nr:hypothetical protein [Chlamydiota bacterium]
MKTQLLALSMIATAGLIAEDTAQTNSNNEQTGYCNTCCSSPCCCKPCCVPKPKKCIDCECYTPAFYDLQCSCGFFLEGEFLYWYARESNLPYAVGVATIPEVPGGTIVNTNFRLVPQKYYHLEADWEPGFRVGLGWNSECDGWDYYLNWTYYQNRASNSTGIVSFTPNSPIEEEQAFLNLWNNQAYFSGSQGAFPFFDKISAKWRLIFNQIDLELGRKYWLSECFTMRPYVGLRGAWTKTTFTVKGSSGPQEDLSMTIIERSSNDRIRNRNWGAGFMTGFQPTWYFCRSDCRNFSLYGNLDAALLWGEFDGSPRGTYFEATGTEDPLTVDVNATSSANEDFFKMHPMLDVAIGLRWEEMWCCNAYRSTLDIGWEHHVWFQHGEYHHSVQSVNVGGVGPGAFNYFTNSINTEHNLMYGGFVVRLKVDF